MHYVKIINIMEKEQEDKIDNGNGQGKKAVSMMSKKRYHQIERHLRDTIGDDNILMVAMEGICNIMNFDPSASTYTPELGKKKHANLKKRCKETGKTTYEILYGKKLQSINGIPSH
jgi:hypothetical protein